MALVLLCAVQTALSKQRSERHELLAPAAGTATYSAPQLQQACLAAGTHRHEHRHEQMHTALRFRRGRPQHAHVCVSQCFACACAARHPQRQLHGCVCVHNLSSSAVVANSGAECMRYVLSLAGPKLS